MRAVCVSMDSRIDTMPLCSKAPETWSNVSPMALKASAVAGSSAPHTWLGDRRQENARSPILSGLAQRERE